MTDQNTVNTTAPTISSIYNPILYTTSEQQHHTIFRYTEWLALYPLHIHTCMDYFKHSPYYDKTCNNEIIAIQQLNNNQLYNMTGIEYQLSHTTITNNSILIINKVCRHSPTYVDIISSYYISTSDTDRGTIYVLPKINNVINYNLQTSLYYINQTVDLLTTWHDDYNNVKESNINKQRNTDDKFDSIIHNIRNNNIDKNYYTTLINDNMRLLLTNDKK